MSDKVLGLIAGQGRLPFLVAEGAKRRGLEIICAALADNADPRLADFVDVYYNVPVARPGAWIKKLKKHNVSETVMVGRVAKQRIFTALRILKYTPDFRALRIWYWRLRGKNKLNQTFLSALADELASGGIILEDSTMFCNEHLADSGPMTNSRPGRFVEADIEFGWQVAKKLAQMDIGQAIAVKERQVIAVEAIEGTAEMIARTGQLCPSGGWTLIKVAKPDHDMRFDVPCVGPDTIKDMAENDAACLVIEAEKTIIIDKPKTIKLADELGIVVIGRK